MKFFFSSGDFFWFLPLLFFCPSSIWTFIFGSDHLPDKKFLDKYLLTLRRTRPENEFLGSEPKDGKDPVT